MTEHSNSSAKEDEISITAHASLLPDATPLMTKPPERHNQNSNCSTPQPEDNPTANGGSEDPPTQDANMDFYRSTRSESPMFVEQSLLQTNDFSRTPGPSVPNHSSTKRHNSDDGEEEEGGFLDLDDNSDAEYEEIDDDDDDDDDDNSEDGDETFTGNQVGDADADDEETLTDSQLSCDDNQISDVATVITKDPVPKIQRTHRRPNAINGEKTATKKSLSKRTIQKKKKTYDPDVSDSIERDPLREQTLHQMTRTSFRNIGQPIRRLEGRLDVLASVLKQIAEDAPEALQIQAWTDKEEVKKDWKFFNKVKEDKKMKTAVRYHSELDRWKFTGIRLPLYHHQMRGVQLMRKWEKAQNRRGGILAYPPGSGKTVMSLANIVNGRPSERERRAKMKENNNWIPRTLIVCPKGLKLQWRQEISKFIEPDLLDKFDIIVASYGDVERDFDLREPHYLRIIVDEGHRIKNQNSNGGKRFSRLQADYRWILSGTPITNRLSEFYGYLHFLQHPIATSMTMKLFSKKHDLRKSPGIMTKLANQTLIKVLHTDTFLGEKVMVLPPAHVSVVLLEFDITTRWLHERLRLRMKQRLERFIEQQKQKRMNHESDSSESDIPPVPTTETSQIPGSGVETDIDTDDEKIETLQLLQDIMRLRQFCDHPATVQAVLEEYFTNEDKKEFIEKVAIFENPSYRSTAQQMLLNMRNRLTEIGDKTHKLLIEEDTSIDDTPTQVLIWDHTTCGQPPSESDRYTELRRETGGVHGYRYNYTPFAKALRTANAAVTCVFCGEASSLEHPILHQLECHHKTSKTCWERGIDAAEADGKSFHCPICSKPADDPPVPIPSIETKRQKTNNRGKWKLQSVTVAPNSAKVAKSAKSAKLSSAKDAKDPKDQVQWLSSCTDRDIFPSAKTIAFKSELMNVHQEAPDDKVVVFTYFNEMTDILQKVCQLEGFQCLKYESKLDCEERDAIVKQFAQDRTVKVLLISTGVGSEGLNLTMANRVLIFSPWWHESREIQAFCRAWRIGQEKTCYLKRFIMRDSVEEHMLNVQRIKQADINAVMTGAEVSEEEPQIRTTIKYLFGIGYKGPIKQKKNLKRMASSDDD